MEAQGACYEKCVCDCVTLSVRVCECGEGGADEG